MENIDECPSNAAKTELERHLQSQNTDGHLDSSGQFTLAREKGMAKLAHFQLPFPGAWAVKLVQAVVASGAKEAIRFVQKRSHTVLIFHTGRAWSLEEIEDSFYDPRQEAQADINHLKAALWMLGISEKRCLNIALSGESTELVWSGTNWERQPVKAASHHRIVITHDSTEDLKTKTWLKRSLLRSSKIADVNLALLQRCFVCPLPLWVDGRRIEALQNCPNFGWSTTVAPLHLGYLEGDLPPFRIPPATFIWEPPMFAGRKLQSRLAKGALTKLPEKEPSVAIQLSAHLSKLRRPSFSNSTCHWVIHGAVIASENFAPPPSYCAVGAYLCANELLTDLSGFALQETLEKQRRLQLTGALIAKALKGLNIPFDEELRVREGLFYRWLAVSGITFLPLLFTPAVGHALILVGTLGALGKGFSESCAEDFEKMAEGLREEITLQAQRWDVYYSRYLL